MLVELVGKDGRLWVNPRHVVWILPVERLPMSHPQNYCHLLMVGHEDSVTILGTAAEVAAKLNAAEARNA